MEKLLAKKSVLSFQEIVWLHWSVIKCLVQLKIFVRWSQNLIKSNFSFGRQKISFKEAKIHFGEQLMSFERAKIPFWEHVISFERAKIPFG